MSRSARRTSPAEAVPGSGKRGRPVCAVRGNARPGPFIDPPLDLDQDAPGQDVEEEDDQREDEGRGHERGVVAGIDIISP